jgi:hypothetical protein
VIDCMQGQPARHPLRVFHVKRCSPSREDSCLRTDHVSRETSVSDFRLFHVKHSRSASKQHPKYSSLRDQDRFLEENPLT